MINFKPVLKNFGILETLVLVSFIYVITMLIWTASTRSAVEAKANAIKENHTKVINYLNDQINECSNTQKETKWGEQCGANWSSVKIIDHLLKNIELNNPDNIKTNIIQGVSDPRIQAEGKAGQSTNIGIIFIPSNDFDSSAGSEWVIGTCVKSPCVAAGNNELISIYR